MLILGGGYVGKALAQAAPGSIVTHRPTSPLGTGELPFALDDERTWDALPTAHDDVVWTFPAAPLALVQALHARKLRKARTLIVLGSTSAYVVSRPEEYVTEETPVDLAQPRVQGEEWLRRQGAVVLQLAGIYGPGREPAGWLRRGLIKSGRKRVNLIHVDDIVAAVRAVQAQALHGERINVSDGEAPLWNDMVDRFRARDALPPEFSLPQLPAGVENKRVSNARLRALLPGHVFRTPA